MRPKRMAGAALLIISLFLFIAPPLTGQSVTCIQSVVPVAQATVCNPPSSYIDSINFGGQVIAPAGGVTQVTTGQGPLTAYYFLATGATVSTYSASYCVWSFASNACSGPFTAMAVSNGGGVANIAGEYFFTAQSPQMTAGLAYDYAFSMTDSLGVKSSLGSQVLYVTPSSQTPTFTATAGGINLQTGTPQNYLIGASPASASVVPDIGTWTSWTIPLTVTITSNLQYVAGVSIAVSNGQTGSLAYNNQGQYVGYIAIAQTGSFTLTGTILANNLALSQTLGTFSVRITSAVQPTQSTIGTCGAGSTTTTAGGFCITVSATTLSPTFSFTSTGCNTGFAAITTTGGQITATATTCTTTTAVCSAGGCSTTATFVTSSGGSSTTSTSVGSTSNTTPTITVFGLCGYANCQQSSATIMAQYLTAILFAVAGSFLFIKGGKK